MKSLKDMKKAVAEFRTSYITMLTEVTVQPIRLASSPFGRRPNLFMSFTLFMVNYLFLFSRTIELVMASDDSGFVIWKTFQVLASL